MDPPSKHRPQAIVREQRIEHLRSQLDEINLQLLRTLEARGRRVREIMALKREIGRAVYDPARERAMLDTLMRSAEGVYSEAALERMFSTIFTESRKLGE